MTNEQFKHANWIKEEIRRAIELRNNLHKCEYAVVIAHMPSNRGHADMPKHQLPASITEVIKESLDAYAKRLEMEFEEL